MQRHNTMVLLCAALVLSSARAQTANPIFPVTFTAPHGWKLLKVENNNAVLIPATAASVDSLLLTHTGLYTKLEPLVTGLARSLKDLGCTQVTVQEEGERVVQGRKVYVAQGLAQNASGAPIAFALYGLLSGRSLGAGIVTLARPEQSAAAQQAAEGLLTSLTFGTFAPSKTGAAALVGTWASSTAEGSRPGAGGGVQIAASTRFTFQSAGRYVSRSQSSASVSGSFGDLGSDLSSSSDTTDEGEYHVVGKKLVLSSTKTGTRVVDYTLQGDVLKVGGATLRRQRSR